MPAVIRRNRASTVAGTRIDFPIRYPLADYIQAQDTTFQEDNVILSSIQREQRATGVVQQTWIAIDEAPTKMRRMLQRMLDAERAQAQP